MSAPRLTAAQVAAIACTIEMLEDACQAETPLAEGVDYLERHGLLTVEHDYDNIVTRGSVALTDLGRTALAAYSTKETVNAD